MSKFKKISGDCWVHESIASVNFPNKPPEWIEPYLVMLYNRAYDMGELHAKNRFKEMMEYFNG